MPTILMVSCAVMPISFVVLVTFSSFERLLVSDRQTPREVEECSLFSANCAPETALKLDRCAERAAAERTDRLGCRDYPGAVIHLGGDEQRSLVSELRFTIQAAAAQVRFGHNTFVHGIFSLLSRP
jgi:hypothetical protein